MLHARHGAYRVRHALGFDVLDFCKRRRGDFLPAFSVIGGAMQVHAEMPERQRRVERLVARIGEQHGDADGGYEHGESGLVPQRPVAEPLGKEAEKFMSAGGLVPDSVVIGLVETGGAVVDGYYYCPHHPEGTVERYRMVCRCRKPGPLLFVLRRRSPAAWPS